MKATDIVDAIRDAARDGDCVRVAQIVNHFDRRSIGAFIMVPALVELTPIGGVPGVPTILAVIIALFAAQIALGREDLWLPGFLENRTVSSSKLDGAADRLEPVARWADRHFGRHLVFFVHPPAPQAAAVAILFLCLLVPPLELIPFASSLPAATIAAFGLALVLRDGRVMLAAWIVFALALWGLWEIAGPYLFG